MTAQQRTLAERVAEAARQEVYSQSIKAALAEFVLAADDKGGCGCGERGFVPCVCGGVSATLRYDAALAALAKALGIEEEDQ